MKTHHFLKISVGTLIVGCFDGGVSTSADEIGEVQTDTSTDSTEPVDSTESTTGESATGESTTGESTTDESTTDESTTDESTTDESTTDESTTDESTTGMEVCDVGSFAVLDDVCPAQSMWRKLGHCEDGSGYIVTDQCVDPLLAECDSFAVPFGGGDGSQASPYLICSVGQLHEVGGHSSSSFALTRALDLGVLAGTDALGYISTQFSGMFDGRGHVIRAELIQPDALGATGLFDDVVQEAAIHDLNVIGSFTSSGRGAMLINTITGGVVERVNVHAGVSSAMMNSSGSAVGVLRVAAVLRDTRGYGDLTLGSFSGGLVGQLRGEARRVRFDGSIDGVQKIGGICGDVVESGHLFEAHASADVTVSDNRGACLTATVAQGGQLTDVLCDGSVTGDYVSGISTEPHNCNIGGCIMLRGVSRAEYGQGSTHIGAETTVLGNGTWTGGNVLVVNAPQGIYSEIGTLVAGADVTPGNPSVAVFEQSPAWTFAGGSLSLAWDLDLPSNCNPADTNLSDCEDGLVGLHLCLPGGVDVTDCMIDL